MSTLLAISGKTADGKPVIDFFAAVDRLGLPPEIVVAEITRRDAAPDWTGFCAKAQAAGWGRVNTIARLDEAARVAYPLEADYTAWRRRLDALVAAI